MASPFTEKIKPPLAIISTLDPPPCNHFWPCPANAPLQSFLGTRPNPLFRLGNVGLGGHVWKPCAVCFGRIGWRILKQRPRNHFPIPLTFSTPPIPPFSVRNIKRNDCHPPPAIISQFPSPSHSPPKPPFRSEKGGFGRIPSFFNFPEHKEK